MPDSLRPWLSFLSALAAMGLALSVLSHLAAWRGTQGPLGNYAFWLHIGIFVVWIPTVLVSQRLTAGFDKRDFWKAALRGCPAWMKYAVGGFFVYALLNFIVFFFNAPPKGSASGPMPLSVVRGFSGHWMAFYSAAMATLYSAARLPPSDGPRPCCPKGHPVGRQARFCEQCGQPVAAPPRG